MAGQDRNRLTRHAAAFTAELLDRDGHSRSVEVENFSLDGCCVRHFLPVGERVSISFPRLGRFDAEVRWGRFGRAGLRFSRAH